MKKNLTDTELKELLDIYDISVNYWGEIAILGSKEGKSHDTEKIKRLIQLLDKLINPNLKRNSK